jgi:integrase
MKKITLPIHESENGTALTLEEEKVFVERCISSGTLSGKAFVFMLCTGIRRSELVTAQLSGEWIVITSAKQRKGKAVRQRRIPISPRLRRLLPNIEEELDTFKGLYLKRLGRTLKEWLPNHHLHELRHTFITRAQECGIPREVVSLWAGHKADNAMTTNV